jgi:PKD repeat protein
MRKYILPMVLFVLFLMPTALAAGSVKINDISANVTSGPIPLHTMFYSKVTGDVTNCRWEFHNIGTGATTYSTSYPSTHHNFGKPGVYDVTLKVWGPAGNDTLTKSAYVNAIAVNEKPVTTAPEKPVTKVPEKSVMTVPEKPASSVTIEPDDNGETDDNSDDWSWHDDEDYHSWNDEGDHSWDNHHW